MSANGRERERGRGRKGEGEGGRERRRERRGGVSARACETEERDATHSRRTSTPWSKRCRRGGLCASEVERQLGRPRASLEGKKSERARARRTPQEEREDAEDGEVHDARAEVAAGRCERRPEARSAPERGEPAAAATRRTREGKGDAQPDAVRRTAATRLTARTRTKNIQMRYSMRTVAWCAAGISSSMLWNRMLKPNPGQLALPLLRRTW